MKFWSYGLNVFGFACIILALSLGVRGFMNRSHDTATFHPSAAAPAPAPLDACQPLESLEDLKKEIDEAIMEYHMSLPGLSKEDSRVRGLVIRARDCHGIKSPQEVGVSEIFWKNIARPLDEIPRREKP